MLQSYNLLQILQNFGSGEPLDPSTESISECVPCSRATDEVSRARLNYCESHTRPGHHPKQQNWFYAGPHLVGNHLRLREDKLDDAADYIVRRLGLDVST